MIFLEKFNKLLYLHESSAHPFRGFLGPKNQARIRFNGALDSRKYGKCNKWENSLKE
jgi:hypothetical protein